MDREQEEMQFLGLFGIYLESHKVVYKFGKIFSQITLTFILPLSFIFLAHLEISHFLNLKISHTRSQQFRTHKNTPEHKKLSDIVTSERALLFTFNVFYYILLLFFSLFSTSAVVYTVASIYTGRDVQFEKIISVVPKVWKRLIVTFLCALAAFFVYNMVALLGLYIWVVSLVDNVVIDVVVLSILVIIYLVGFVYMTIIWQLASVISALEDLCGFKAMLKSKDLIKGKLLITLIIFFKLNFSLAAVQVLFKDHVVHGQSFGFLPRLGFGLVSLLVLFKLVLFVLVIQTIVYFVCKSYHHENIDKSALSDHLEVYLGDYVPLKAKDVQLEQYDV